MADVSRRDFIKAGVAGAALLTYTTPTIETFMMADAWADEEKGGREREWYGEERRHPTKKMMKHSPRGHGGGLEMERSED